ncbi:MAG: GNAT family N-acetyltransferase [Chthonomonadales bacterium]
MIRPFDVAKDSQNAIRIWKEVGWHVEGSDQVMIDYLNPPTALVAEINGDAECLVAHTPASLRYGTSDLPLCIIGGVTTSLVARKQGLAARVLAQMLANRALAGEPVATLGMFEQGFYDRLGFGTSSYENRVNFDPALLNVPGKYRAPIRIAKEEFEEMHAARLTRLMTHGNVTLDFLPATKLETETSTNGFGLGYRDKSGKIGHHLWFETDDIESGPLKVKWMNYRNRAEFHDLLHILRSFGEQIYIVKMAEPPLVQFQDLLIQPFKHRRITAGGSFVSEMKTRAPFQFRMLDIETCVEAVKSPVEVAFNLTLADPISDFLPDDAAWQGLAGDYVVKFGTKSSVEQGSIGILPTLKTTVGAFTRLWLGVRPASFLAMTDDLDAPDELLKQLDSAITVHNPQTGWDY